MHQDVEVVVKANRMVGADEARCDCGAVSKSDRTGGTITEDAFAEPRCNGGWS